MLQKRKKMSCTFLVTISCAPVHSKVEGPCLIEHKNIPKIISKRIGSILSCWVQIHRIFKKIEEGRVVFRFIVYNFR